LGARILIVEHQESDLREITARLNGNGHELVIARDMRSGVEAAQRQRPRLILCALVPPSDGTQLLLKLRVDAGFDDIPVVAVTRFGDERQSLLNVGFSGVIGKPITDAFLSEVESFLR